MLRRKSTCVESTEKNLLELKRKAQLESLRYHLSAYSCFPPTKDPSTTLITFEEIKKLARAWKLHERRNNFWKTYTSLHEMVEVVLEHAIDNKIDLTLVLEGDRKVTPSEPESPKQQSSFGGSPRRASVNYGLTTGPSAFRSKPRNEVNFGRQANITRFAKNYFGNKNFVDINENVLSLMSRFSSVDKKAKVMKLSKVINNWRENNFFLEDRFGGDSSAVNTTKEYSTQALRNMKSRKMKQRTLAVHLANYSSNNPDEFADMGRKDVEIFVAISDCDDPYTMSTCAVALSNIASDPAIRNILVEMNAVHKLTAMVPHFQTANILHAASLLFFYMSCEREVEDRIYSGYFMALQNSSASSDMETKLLALHTLNNLLPCIERHRICDLLISSIQNAKLILEDEPVFGDVLNMILNMSVFTSLHSLMIDCDVFEIIAQAANRAAAKSDRETGRVLMKMLNNFLFSPDISDALINQDFVPILVDLLGIGDDAILRYGFKTLAVLALRREFTLKVFESDVLSIISGVIFNERLTTEAAGDAARFLTSLTLIDSKAEAKRLLADGVPSALAKLISPEYDSSVRITAVKGLQNFFVHKDVAVKFVDTSLDAIFSVLTSTGEVSAAMCLYNLARFEACEAKLVQKKAHLSLLNATCNTPKATTKSACLQALALFSGNERCIIDLIDASLIPRISEIIALTDKSTWIDISKMILSIVARSSSRLSDADKTGIERILAAICKKKLSSEAVLLQSMRIIAFLSFNISDFSALDIILRSILSISDSDEIAESVAIVLYNVSCSKDCICSLLRDDTYLHVMIRMMRTGKVSVQVTIAEALRTMCSLPECITLLLKGDIMADFIAIALLRTSNPDVKAVCSQAFYNVFCHAKSRLKLLKGGLWWSMMRLARADINAIRKTCSYALFQVSSEASIYGDVLRGFHILAFIRDVAREADEDIMKEYILSIEYLLSEFRENLISSEISALLETVRYCMVSFKNEELILGAIRITLKCACCCTLGSELDFIKFDTFKTLHECEKCWTHNVEALFNVSTALQYLTKFETFSKQVSVADLNLIITALDSHASDVKVSENIALVFLNCVSLKTVTPEELVTFPVWVKLLNDSIYLESKASSSSLLRSILISILGSNFESMNRISNCAIVDLFVGMFEEKVVKNSPTIRNILSIVSACSLDTELSEKVIDAGLVSFLWKLIHGKFTVSETQVDQDLMFEYSMNILKNITLHRGAVAKFVRSPNSKTLLDVCSHKPKREILMDMCSILFRTLEVPIPKSPGTVSSLSPEVVCSVSTTICEQTDDRTIAHMAKFIIGSTLDKYNVELGCAPGQVQSMFSEMNDRETSTIPTQLGSITKTKNSTISPVLIENSAYSEAPVIPFTASKSSNVSWKPIMNCKCKTLDVVVHGLANPEPIHVTSFEPVDPIPLSHYYKTVRQYPLVRLLKSDFPIDDFNETNEYEDDQDFEGSENKSGLYSSNPVCQICIEVIATFKCMSCEPLCQFYCNDCVEGHNKKSEFSDHLLNWLEYSEHIQTNGNGDDEACFHLIPAYLAASFSPDEISSFRHHFLLIDEDKGGTIDALELQALTESLGKRVSLEHAKSLIKDFDEDGSGSIDFVEFVKLMYNIRHGKGSIEDNELVTAIYQNQVKLVKSRASTANTGTPKAAKDDTSRLNTFETTVLPQADLDI